MTRHEIRLEHGRWSVTCFIGYHADADTDEISRALEGMGCTGEALLEAQRHLAKDSEDRGLTYSNVRGRESVVAVGRSGDHASGINTIAHELLHVVQHVCEQDGISMTGEEACYMMGELCERVFVNIFHNH